MANCVINAGPEDTPYVKTAVLVEVFILNCHCGLANIGCHLASFNRHAFNGIIILPKQCFTASIVITNATTDVITGSRKVGKIFPKISENRQQKYKASNKTKTNNFKSHDTTVAAEPVVVHASGFKVIKEAFETGFR